MREPLREIPAALRRLKMKVRVSDYIAEKIADSGITDVFSVTGGGSMYLNDSLGHFPRLHCLYQHHEQACAMAAEAYARVDGRPAAVCVTSGPGAVNAMTGVLCAWMESIPMLVLSGQVRYAVTVRSTGLPIRTMGIQEYDVTKASSAMTKYAVMVEKKENIRYELEKALYRMRTGRRGPVWLDIPLDVQSGMIEPEELTPFDPAEDGTEEVRGIPDETVDRIIGKLKEAERPVLFAGFGVRASGSWEMFRKLVRLLDIPVTVGASSVDLLPYGDPDYVGVSGVAAGRAGNFALQNSDVYLSLGSRQSISQTGFDYKDWARGAYTILNDLDENELKKPNLHVSLPVVGDVRELIEKLTERLLAEGCSEDRPLFRNQEWKKCCADWKERYPVVTATEKAERPDGCGNIYAFYDALSDALGEGEYLAVSCGTSRVAGTQAFRVKEGQRFFTNSQTASMGYGLPAAVGLSISGGRKCVTLVTGEGSLMMNLQELQTIAGNRLPIRIFVICNGGYHSIRQTQKNFFGGEYVGIGPESGDLSFPKLSAVSEAFGLNYTACRSNATMKEDVEKALSMQLPCLAEVRVSSEQATEPKASSRRLADGTMVSSPLEDMAPFLSREELKANMKIDLTREEASR